MVKRSAGVPSRLIACLVTVSYKAVNTVHYLKSWLNGTLSPTQNSKSFQVHSPSLPRPPRLSDPELGYRQTSLCAILNNHDVILIACQSSGECPGCYIRKIRLSTHRLYVAVSRGIVVGFVPSLSTWGSRPSHWTIVSLPSFLILTHTSPEIS